MPRKKMTRSSKSIKRRSGAEKIDSALALERVKLAFTTCFYVLFFFLEV